MAVVLDSDAVVGFLDRGDALHESAEAAVRELLQAREPVLASVVSFAEVLAGAKLGHHDESVVRGFFENLVSGLLAVDAEVAERAAELRARSSALRMPDALILASADLHPEVDRLISGDRGALRVDGLSCRIHPLAPA